MKITINDQEKEIQQEKIMLEELLLLEQVEMPQSVSVQINDVFISGSDYKTTQIKEGDVINFLYFMGGGA